MRCKIDYIRCSEDLKKLYPEIFYKLEDHFKERDVSFIYELNDEFPVKYAVQCGNKHEYDNLSVIPRIIGLEPIMSIEFKGIGEFTEEEIEDYKNKLFLIIEIG